MERPNINDFRLNGGNTILIGSYKNACIKYSNAVKAKTGKTDEFPNVLHFVDGSGLTNKKAFRIAIDKHFENIE